MAFTVIFYQIDKKQNSTKQPAVADPKVSLDCTLKGPCSILQPVIQITKAGSLNLNAMPTTYNYCYIANWNRYYFVTNWVWSGAILTASLTVDVLASYKTQIGNASLYVARAASSYDGTVIDTTYPTKAAVTFSKNTLANPFSGHDGVYVVGIISELNSGSGTVTYYAFNSIGFRAFCHSMFSSISWMNIDPNEISEDLQKALVNPFQYVVSCQYLPIDVTDVTSIPDRDYGTDVYFGFWNFTVSQGYTVIQPTYFKTYTGTLTIPKHPQAATRGAYLNLSPYSSYVLACYPFGFIPIDSTDIMDAASIGYAVNLDLCTGRAIATLYNGNNIIRVIETQVGVTIPTTSIQIDWTNWKSGVVSAGAELIAGAASESSLGGFLSAKWQDLKSVISGNEPSAMGEWESKYAGQGSSGASSTNIGSSALAAMAKPEISGALGMQTGYTNQAWAIVGKFLTIADEDISHRGRPLCTTVQLNTLSGFIQVADADISIAGVTASEQSAIIAFLTSGFFYE